MYTVRYRANILGFQWSGTCIQVPRSEDDSLLYRNPVKRFKDWSDINLEASETKRANIETVTMENHR